jgi:hypothetical protein
MPSGSALDERAVDRLSDAVHLRPQIQHVLRTAALGAASWLIALALGLGKFLAVEARKAVLRAFQVRNM